MNDLDKKITSIFEGMVVRKDLVKKVKGNAIVPSYVLEYLLGQYCATSDQSSIESGIETVKDILRKHYVHRNESGLIKSQTKEKGMHKVIDKVSVELNDKAGYYEATFSNLGISEVLVDSDTVKKHPKTLVSGVWCIAEIGYEVSEDKSRCPWILHSLKPIQLSGFDFDEYIEKRSRFTTDEWINLLIQSMGFNPVSMSRRNKLLQLVRLIPYCERNYNLIELGPKGTGKSHIFSEFSPHGILISGGEVTVPKLFVNNASGKIGLVGYWDVVAFDEFAGKKKKVDRALVDIMKNYMANKSFSRGVETLGAEASMVFVGNTQHNVAYMLKHTDLFDELPDNYHDSAFLDRLHFYIPGWEIDIIRADMFSDGYGFVVDYLAEILKSLRNHDYSHEYTSRFTLLSDISTRDRDAILKTFSGLMKILYPSKSATLDEVQEILNFSIEGRKRIKGQLLRIDTTYAPVRFGYSDNQNKEHLVKTLEEVQYPDLFDAGARNSSVSTGQHESDDSTDLFKEHPKDEDGLSDRESDSDRETSNTEFKSTLRVNLHTGQKDPKIELSCLKTIAGFLNQNGGTLIIGVSDEGEPLGSDLDQFENEDKLSLHLVNLVNDRIGPQFMMYIQPRFKDYRGKSALFVSCSKSSSPVYVKDGNLERFYIRTGVSTTELTPSQTSEFIKQRF